MDSRTQLLVRGIVQGVGFRPYVFSLAHRNGLRGRVFNQVTGVLIDLEGESDKIEQFIHEMFTNPPPLALVEAVERSDNLAPQNYHDFRILESDSRGNKFVLISPDIATCKDCFRELFDPKNRRHRYPFINCRNCGPRFTIIEDVPYDRTRTTMRDFEMCRECRAEYVNPIDRRFHAEPTACGRCGPQLRITDTKGCEINVEPELSKDAIAICRDLLSNGKIIAIKGIGGFHLACDAVNRQAVDRLRQRKFRENKPFGLMSGSLDIIKKYAYVDGAAETLLCSEQRPIVLLERKADADLPHAIAPGIGTLGFLLSYSPLHHLLCEDMDHPLVLTSGNVSDEPICYENEEALERLKSVADYFLLHDRRIGVRADDSVTRVFRGRERVLRRSRGYAPAPLRTAVDFGKEILACGGELKNTFCLTRQHYAFLSHHIGDLENLETFQAFTEGIERFKQLFHLQPEVVAYDLHPEYLSTKYALALDPGLTRIAVQHHHAHIASCMADNGIEGDVIGVAMDGLGFGTDGCMWGGEFFVANFIDAQRVAHLQYIPLPGAKKAIREPWRMAAMYLQQALGDDFVDLDLCFTQGLDRTAWKTLRRIAASGINSPLTSSMGRLFDAVSSLVSLRHTVNYEGQAAIELEAIAGRDIAEGYQFEISGEGEIISADSVIRQAVADLLNGVSQSVVSARFHYGAAQIIATVAESIREKWRLNRVALSGGVFQNVLLLEYACRMLTAAGFEVFIHGRVPPNDGGIALGQAVVANARIAAGRV